MFCNILLVFINFYFYIFILMIINNSHFSKRNKWSCQSNISHFNLSYFLVKVFFLYSLFNFHMIKSEKVRLE